jgi:Holliday junction DNA helicase RuvA
MISRIKGNLLKKEQNRVIVEVGGICYEISVPSTVADALNKSADGLVELVIYHYLNVDKHRAIPVLVGFLDDLEKDFFEKFIGISGIGPKVALKAFDRPIPLIAQAIEEGDIAFLKTLEGIGLQKAKQIIATLQGKVGRFALLKADEHKKEVINKEVIAEAKEVLKRLQYSSKEIDDMLVKASKISPQPQNVEELLNEIYRQKKIR